MSGAQIDVKQWMVAGVAVSPWYAFAATPSNGMPTLFTMVTSANNVLESVVAALLWGMYALGTWFIASGIMDSMKKSVPAYASHITGGRIMSRIAFGGAFLGAGYTLSLVKTGVTANGAWNDYGLYGASHAAGNDPFSQFALAITRFVQVYGGWSVFKGLLLWKSAGDGQDRPGEDKGMSGATHILFGGLCADCVNTYRAVAETLNFPVPAFFPT